MISVKRIGAIAALVVFFISCNNDVEIPAKNKEVKKEQVANPANLTYFYPTSIKPLVYVYSVNNNPFLETYLKITSVKSKGDTLMMLEYFDANLELKEGYTINLNKNFEVINHMTSSNGIKYTSKISKNNFFPMEGEKVARFMVDFPTTNDTVVALFERDLELVDTISYMFQDDLLTCIKAIDHIRLTRLHTITKKENVQLGEIVSLYAEGIGKVAQFPSAGGDTMKLVRTIAIEEWDKLTHQL